MRKKTSAKSIAIIMAFFMSMIFAFFTHAQSISVNKAAKHFISTSFNADLLASKLDTAYSLLINNQGDTLAYVYRLIPKGYIVLSNRKGITPVIAFSTENNFDFHPGKKNVLLDMLNKDISHRLMLYKQALINGDSGQFIMNYNKWDNLLKQTTLTKSYDTQYGPLLSSVWGGVNCVDFYSNPIFVGNYYTPNHYSPGCVATATSIVLHYYKWPLSGVGYHTDFDNSGSSIGSYYANFGATDYLWGRMLDKYYLKTSKEKNQRAMGLLSYHTAVAFDMDFEFSGSTSNLNRSPSVLDNYFRFSGHYQTSSWNYFWPRMRENIRNKQPVTIAISKTNGEGHAMVCDGYGQDAGQNRFYHLQFGWWGSYNGWYDIQGNWNASGYSIIDGAVFDILPDPMIGKPLRTDDEFEFTIPILVSDSLHWNSFKIWESYNGGNWSLLDANVLSTDFQRKVTKSGNYRYKAQAKVNGNYYANSTSMVGEVNVERKDSALVSLAFDGDDSFFVRDNARDYLDIKDNYTIETWVKVDKFNPNSSYDVILDRRTVFSLYLISDFNADYAVRFVTRNGSDAITASLRSDSCAQNLKFGDWVHIAISRHNDTATLFLNGNICDYSLDTNFSLRYSLKALNVGARYWGGYGRYLMGEMDEIRISDTARYLPNKTFNPYRCMNYDADSNTILLLHLDENSGDAIGDFSGNFSNINLRSSPHYPNWIKENQMPSVVYGKKLSARIIDKGVELSWTTSFEVNNEGFEILKSLDNSRWSLIGKKEGKASSSQIVEYTFVDDNPVLGQNYYRLRQIEPLCRYSMSAPDSVLIVPSGKINIYPNPTSDVLEIDGMEGLEIASIRFFDSTGKQISLAWINESQLNVSHLSAGIYLLIIEVDGAFVQKKFIIE